eukprot:TRINITY_DN15102_c0_g1_i1.p1 TRINITY_DN15102_c0_g1~~TRINITY_DN15102_c0_g1_i1.p1  ORF type:complete len:746 (+),score=158.98 TRINITY_DN15102_c0_g1_i1:45-2282(+)
MTTKRNTIETDVPLEKKGLHLSSFESSAANSDSSEVRHGDHSPNTPKTKAKDSPEMSTRTSKYRRRVSDSTPKSLMYRQKSVGNTKHSKSPRRKSPRVLKDPAKPTLITLVSPREIQISEASRSSSHYTTSDSPSSGLKPVKPKRTGALLRSLVDDDRYSTDEGTTKTISLSEDITDAESLLSSPRGSMTDSPFHAENLHFKVVLETQESSKVAWVGNKKLESIIDYIVQKHKSNFNWDDYELRDKDNKRLDPSKTLEELNIDMCKITLKEKEYITIYLPKTQIMRVLYMPEKKIGEVLESVLEAKPELKARKLKTTDSLGNSLDSLLFLADVPEKKIFFGTTFKEWDKSRGTPKIEDLPSGKKNIKLYLPHSEIQIIDKMDCELEKILEKARQKDVVADAEPLDIEDRPLDPKKPVGDLGVGAIFFGVNAKNWTNLKAQDYISHYLNNFQTVNEDNSKFKIYLPDGNFSSLPYFQNKHKILREVLHAKFKSRPTDLELAKNPTNLKGEPLNTELALDELGVREICVGTDILHWAITDWKQKNPEWVDSEVPINRQRLLFLGELESIQNSNLRKNDKEIRNSPNLNVPKSPPLRKYKVKGNRVTTPFKPVSQVVINMNIEKNRNSEMDVEDQKHHAILSWHTLNYQLNDYHHYLHFFEDESNFKSLTNHQVPYPFGLPSKYKKNVFQHLSPSTHKCQESTPAFNDYELNMSSFDNWKQEMDQKVTSKQLEHSELYVSFMTNLDPQ